MTTIKLTDRETLLTLLDHVDYAAGACRPNEPVGAVLPPLVLERARVAAGLHEPSGESVVARVRVTLPAGGAEVALFDLPLAVRRDAAGDLTPASVERINAVVAVVRALETRETR